ncbi:multi-sensor hybrid histidine kinase [Desulfobulbus propionicus DSM 2032]|uniref:histidine kinase n=1 Tax=Desulfobulbus propionicus (strain ATCC 33891 / DSM 2032 / VKM B-1956 / 1pr3) TaxID=577650 RepID=A0A7U3YP80_DESPD|nr:PAS domain S-box protein [Desulfobulbus propionicus]ADW18878.1 multi-sensor hybrid histidine kinase [Desulfobulbus propionicus DSM 2032]
MTPRFSYQPIVLALLATLVLAGLFYLPYLSVRTKTIDAFYTQQMLLAQQAGSGLQSYFATYTKALTYLSEQGAIKTMEDSGKALLLDFFSIHTEDISNIQRIDANGASLFTFPEDTTVQGESAHCLRTLDAQTPLVSDVIAHRGAKERIFFSIPVLREERFDGCLSLSLPYARIANRYLNQIPMHDEGYVLLFSRSGTILHAPDTSFIGREGSHLHGPQEDIALLRSRIAAQEQTLVRLRTDPIGGGPRADGAVFAVVYPVSLPGDNSWSIVLVTPAQKVLGAMAAFRSQWLVVTGLAVVSVGLLSFFLSGNLAKRREEQRLQAMKEQLAGLLDLAPMGVFLLDPRGVVVYANQEAKRLVTDTTEAVVAGRPLIDFLHRSCRPAVAAQIKDSIAGQAVQVEAAQLLTASGSLRDVVITATPYQIGSLQQCILIVRDVSAERKSAAWQRRLAAAVDQVKEAVLIVDDQGIIEYANVALGEMTGYSRGECGGQPARMLWAREQDAHFDQKFEDVVKLGEVWRGRIVNQRKDGSLFVAAATVSPVRDTMGAITHYVLVQRDITHEVEIDARMRQAQKMEAIGTLAGGIAHDFNNILGGIIGFTDMALLQCAPGTELHSNLLHIRQGGKRAADLVQQILTFSRQSAEEKSPVVVAALIQESLKLMRATLPATIDIKQELWENTAKVMAAPVQIQQIVMNLCANAFYSMKEKGGRLTLRLRRKRAAELGKTGDHEAGDWLALVVEDTGQGMENETLQRIFTPFFTTKKPGEGTGMGLSVVHGIVRDLGGEITVRSQPEEGTVFTVLLPLVDQEPHGELLSGEGPLLTGTEHVLVVDDEKEIRETCRMMLGHLGYAVTTSGSPLEVLALLDRAQPPVDLVITDQTMPKMTGLDLTEEIRRLHPEIPVILCTGYSDRLNYDIAREAGACDLLMKPVDLRGLSAAVRSALDMSN